MSIHSERLKWMEQLLAERFGQNWQISYDNGNLMLRLTSQPGRVVFDRLEPSFMQTGRPQKLSCEWWQIEYPWQSVLGEPRLPAPSTKSLQQPLIDLAEDIAKCHYDILGLAFWAMNRLEEVGGDVLDEHQRFQASESHAVKYSYLDRPLVDEWLYVLGQVIQKQWPQIELKKHQFQVVLSHDVDRPSRYGFRSVKGLIRAIGGDVVRRWDIKSLLVAPWVRLNTKHQLHPWDTFNTFDWIMDQSEKIGVKSTFNFICTSQLGAHEPDYKLEHPAIRSLIRNIYSRGHLIGLHPSYSCYLNPEKIQLEFERLKKICQEEGVEQSVWGGRMHYLRWSQPRTLAAWDACGLDYDSTLSFADQPGFRCGSCFEYATYDVIKEIMLSVREKPLIAMEASVLSPNYMGVKSTVEAVQIFNSLKDKCRKLGGDFNLLWHNTELVTQQRRLMYRCSIRV